MGPDTPDPGKVLYEERLALLPGLWMNPAPPWEDLSETDRDRWRGYATAAADDEDRYRED